MTALPQTVVCQVPFRRRLRQRGKTSASPVEAAPKVPQGRVPRIARLMAALRAASLRGQDPELRGAGQARACQPGTSCPNHAAAFVSAHNSRSSIVLAANYVWPRSYSPAAAPVRGRRIGMATTARSLEGTPGNDAGYGVASRALRIEKTTKRGALWQRTC